MFTIKIQCKEHPKYMAIRTPKVRCQSCWDMFYLKQNIKKVQNGEDVKLDYLGYWLKCFL